MGEGEREEREAEKGGGEHAEDEQGRCWELGS